MHALFQNREDVEIFQHQRYNGENRKTEKVKKNGDAEMKKTRGFLALVLAAALAVSGAAAAGKEDVTGTWELDRVLYNGEEYPADSFDVGLRVEVREDGTASMETSDSTGDKAYEAVWELEGDELTLYNEGQAAPPFTWTEGTLRIATSETITLVLEKTAAPEEPVATEEPAAEPTVEPAAELTEIPTPEPAPEVTEKPAAEPTAEPVPEPTEEPIPEPTAEPVPEPTAEPTEEPTPEPTAEPTAEPTPEPTEEPAQPTAEEIADRAFELLEAGNYDEAVPLMFEAAGEGSARALSGLGYCYYRGYGVEENNEEAVKWFRLAAKQGIADAQYYLGMCLYYGWGTAQDDAEAAEWFRKAAEQGDARGQYYLGNCIHLGRGAEQNEAEAVKWFRLSAEQGYPRAMYSLGYMIYTGSGTVKDEAAAKEWIRKALDAGVKLSEEELARAEELLGGEDAQ